MKVTLTEADHAKLAAALERNSSAPDKGKPYPRGPTGYHGGGIVPPAAQCATYREIEAPPKGGSAVVELSADQHQRLDPADRAWIASKVAEGAPAPLESEVAKPEAKR